MTKGPPIGGLWVLLVEVARIENQPAGRYLSHFRPGRVGSYTHTYTHVPCIACAYLSIDELYGNDV